MLVKSIKCPPTVVLHEEARASSANSAHSTKESFILIGYALFLFFLLFYKAMSENEQQQDNDDNENGPVKKNQNRNDPVNNESESCSQGLTQSVIETCVSNCQQRTAADEPGRGWGCRPTVIAGGLARAFQS